MTEARIKELRSIADCNDWEEPDMHEVLDEIEKLRAALKSTYGYVKALHLKHDMSLADASIYRGEDGDGSDRGAMDWLMLDCEIREALGEK